MPGGRGNVAARAIKRVTAVSGAFPSVVARVACTQVGAYDGHASNLVAVVVPVVRGGANLRGTRKERIALICRLELNRSTGPTREWSTGRTRGAKGTAARRRKEVGRKAGVGSSSCAHWGILAEVTRLRVAVQATRAVRVKGGGFDAGHKRNGSFDHWKEPRRAKRASDSSCRERSQTRRRCRRRRPACRR